MRFMQLLPIVLLSAASTLALANNNKNNKLDDVNCGNLASDSLRKECRQRKYGSKDGKKVDCGKLDNDKLRRECRQEKWD